MKRYAIVSAAVLLLLSACGPTTDVRPEAIDPLVGAWRSQVAFRDGALAAVDGLEFMYAFAAGGTLTESSNFDGAPPVPPAYGVWRRIAPGHYEARYLFYTTQPPADWQAVAGGGGWSPAGHGELRETIELAADGQSFTSTLSVALYDVAGKPVAGGGTATGRGKRIAL